MTKRAEDREVVMQSMEWLVGGWDRRCGDVYDDARARQLRRWNTPPSKRTRRPCVRYD